MKILIAAIILMAFGQQAWAFEKNTHEWLSRTWHDPYATDTFCIDGYKFVVASKGESVAITQFYERLSDNTPFPAKCSD